VVKPLQRGLTLIELIIFIVVIGVGLVGILAAYNTVVMRSADPLATTQALTLAESLLFEIEQQPFTWCDPQDANFNTAASYADCATASQQPPGPRPPGETRGDASNPFDNVGDYDGYTVDAGTISPLLAGYTLSVAIAHAGTALGLTDDTAALRIAVTVAGRGESITLTGYRTRYAPRSGG
jgi:MSHA pilin protein MshD